MAITGVLVAITALGTYLTTKSCACGKAEKLQSEFDELKRCYQNLQKQYDILMQQKQQIERERNDYKKLLEGWQNRAGRLEQDGRNLANAIKSGNTQVINFAVQQHDELMIELNPQRV